MKTILLITTGGTIASIKSEAGLVPGLNSNDLLRYIPQVKDICNIETLQLMNLDSTNINETHWLKMERAIEENYDLYDGFVICHGTDTMAYTAAALSYLIQNSRKPIVLTGSQKPIDFESTDAKTNLLDSLRFAVSDQAEGVQLIFGGHVIAGTRAKKVRTKSYNAFTSINYPAIAIVQEEKIIYYIEPKHHNDGEVHFFHHMKSSVFLLKIVPGLRAEMLDYILEHYDAVIIEAFGVGGLPTGDNDAFFNVLKKWTKRGKVIVISTQVLQEGSDIGVYEVGYRIKELDNVMETRDMTMEASVTKLMWILGMTGDPGKVKELFYKNVYQDILYYR